MSAYLGAVRIQDKHGDDLRLQHRDYAPYAGTWPKYRIARGNGWHCGHWHRTPEDAVQCAVAKGAPMD